MNKIVSLLTGVALTAWAVSVSAASAQDMTRSVPYPVDSVTSGRTIVELGGGVQHLDLPDINFTFLTDKNGKAVSKQKNGELDDYGGVLSGSVYVPIRRSGGTPVTFVISGFFANVDNTRRTNCSSTKSLDCTVENIVDNPNQLDSWTFDGFTTITDREADFWGASTEVAFGRDRPKRPRYEGGYLFDVYHFGIGADVRGIDQDNRIRIYPDGQGDAIRYNETLDTTYYGGYLSVTGEYNILGFFGIGGSWGIRSFATFRAGLYGADTDYTGRFDQTGNPTTRLGLSDNEAAFIGSASFETRKQFGGRTSLSLLTDYEYYSYVPRMRYADADQTGNNNFAGNISHTFIDDDDTLAIRSQIRFNIGLGPDALYDETPLK